MSHTKLGGIKSEVRCCMPMFLQEFIGRIFFLLWYFWSWCDACCFVAWMHLPCCCLWNCKSLEGPAYVFFFCLFFTYKDISHFGIWCSSTKTQFLSKFRGWGWESSKFLSTFPLEKMSFSEPRAHELPRLVGQQGLVICPKHWSWRPVKPHQAFTLVPKIQIQVPIHVQQILYWLSHFSNSNF